MKDLSFIMTTLELTLTLALKQEQMRKTDSLTETMNNSNHTLPVYSSVLPSTVKGPRLSHDSWPKQSSSSEWQFRTLNWKGFRAQGMWCCCVILERKGKGFGMAEEFAMGSEKPRSWSNAYVIGAITAPQQDPSCCMGSSLESPPLNVHSLSLCRGLRGVACEEKLSGERPQVRIRRGGSRL